MPLNDYDFDMDDPAIIAHVERHIQGSTEKGSIFFKDVFPDAKSLIGFVLGYFADYNGTRTVIEIEHDREVGYDSLISLEDLPCGAVVTLEERIPGGPFVNIVRGIEPAKTRIITAVAGPLENGRHGFYTIFPGRKAPPFPLTENELKASGSSCAVLEVELKKQEEYRAFWNSHGFIDS